MKQVLPILFIMLSFSACKTTKYVEVEKVRTEYHNSVDTIRDSIYHDVFRNIYIKGDTVYNTTTEYLYRYKYINNSDTLIQRDSIPYMVEVEKRVEVEVEKPLSWWQKALMWIGGISIALFAVIAYIKLTKV